MLINQKYALKDVAKITNGKIIGNENSVIKNIYYDTRIFVENNGHLFIAIQTKNNDGHLFINHAYEKGIRLFLINKYPKIILEGASYLIVDNSLMALQKWAEFHRKKFKLPVLAITGSYGKTIVKEWLYFMLKKTFKIIRSPKSFNSQLGTALSILTIEKSHELAIIEAGISKPGDMEKLRTIINPNYALITNIGLAHAENFRSKQHLIDEKMKLVEDVESYYFSKHEGHVFKINSKGQLVITNYLNKKETFQIPQKDEYSAKNFICCLRFMEKLLIDVNLIKKLCVNLPDLALRMEKKEGINQSVIINDSYHTDLPSLKIALEILKSESEDQKTTLILSEINSKISSAPNFYTQVSNLIKAFKIDQFIAVGKTFFKNKNKFNGKSIFFKSTKDLLAHIKDIDIKENYVLIKGSKEEFQKISLKLESKKHATTLEINLENIEKNFITYKSLLKAKTKILVMIKAAGYGTGLLEIGKKLAKIDVDFLGVAYTDEGVELRKSKIKCPILVMNVELNAMEDIIENDLTPVIHDLNQLNEFTNKLIGFQILNFPIHVKINTGMNRMGIDINEIEELLEFVTCQPEIEIKGVFSHLAASDTHEGEKLTKQQINNFISVTKKIEKKLNKPVVKHILNTSGIENYTDNCFDMVRLGIGIYGISKNLKLNNVATLKTKISKIRTVSPNNQIGYGTKSTVKQKIKIGIIPIGYADGFSRALGNGKATVFINGNYAPTFGNICMDMSFINLTSIDAKIGDTVEIFGENNSIEKLASSINTIPYEILSSISNRVVRVYNKD